MRPTAGRQYVAEGTRTYSDDCYITHILLADRPQRVPVGVYQTRLGQRSCYCAYGTGWTSHESHRARYFLAEVSSLQSSGKKRCLPGGKRPGREVYRLPYMEPRLRTSGVIPSQPLMLSWRAKELYLHRILPLQKGKTKC